MKARIEHVAEECYEEQLKKNVNEDRKKYAKHRKESTSDVAGKVARIMSQLYPLPTRWIVGVYADKREQLEQMGRADVQPIKPKVSAHYNIRNISGYNVALFPFPDGTKPKMIDGNSVDVFCNRPVIGSGNKPTCGVGSADGEYIYDELRRLRIVPDAVDLLVVPSAGKLSVRTVPFNSFPPFFSKHYSDYDIIIF